MNTVEQEQASVYNGINQRLLQECREDCNTFLEYTLKDEKTGAGVEQGEIHRLMQDFIDHCWSNDKNDILIMAPFGHGKSVQVIGRCLFELGNNPDIRAKVVCNADSNATMRVKMMKSYIESSEEFQDVFPGCKPDYKQAWGSHKITVQRSSFAKDDSVEAQGILSAGISGRCDLLFVDDAVDFRNSVQQASMKKSVTEAFHTVWRSRLDGVDARTIVIGTMWTNDDLMAQLASDQTFARLIISVNDDITGLDCRVYGA